jgi:hypothetical protein
MRTLLVRPWLWLSLLSGSFWFSACGDQFTATSGAGGTAEAGGEPGQAASGRPTIPPAGSGDDGGAATRGGTGSVSVPTGAAGAEQGGAPTVVSSAYRHAVLDDKPLVYWRMGASKDRVVPDETSGGNDLVLQGTGHTLGVQGAIEGDTDGAIELDGKASFAIATNSRVLDFMGGAKFTLECWAQRESGGESYFQHLFSNVQGVAGNRDGFALYLLPEPAPGENARSVFEYDRPAADLGIWGPVFDANLWAYYVAVFDGTQISLYANATLSETDVTTGNIAARTVPFTVGRAAGVDGSYFKGALDELAIYPRALTSAEIAEHYSYARAP